MSVKTYPVPESWSSSAWINNEKYRAMYDQSVNDPDGFWREQASRIDWIKPFTKDKEHLSTIRTTYPSNGSRTER